MTSEELKEARELSIRCVRLANMYAVDEPQEAADTITRLCDEVERLQRERVNEFHRGFKMATTAMNAKP